MWYFTAPQVVFGEDALSHIAHIHGQRAFIISDATLAKIGVVGQVEQHFHAAGMETAVFAEVEPEPSLQTVRRGAEAARAFEPDWIVAVGGGSPMDAAKAIWVLYERPELDPTDINPMDDLGLVKAKLMAIPTTAGTGSREVIPTVAIVDPVMTAQLPARITADTGLDALTHAVEGYTSTWRNDFSDGLCLKAVQLVFDYLPRAVADGKDDLEAREKMGNAATIAGLGFGNANLGLAHAMGHSLGALFKQPHGRVVALFLPYTMEFTVNGGLGRYGDLARFAGLTESRDEEEAGHVLVDKVRALEEAVGQPTSIAALGVDRDEFEAALERLCDHAEMDTQYFTAPRIPERDELERIFRYAYDGKAIDF